LYWNSASAYPAALLLGAAPADAARSLEARFARVRDDPESVTYVEAVRNTRLVTDLLEGKLAVEWARAQVVRDDPAKTLDPDGRTDLLLLAALLPAIGTPSSSFDLVSPYFVPGEGGTEALVDLASRGVRVRVLTNALAATDVAPVHAGYAKRRCTLLRAGVRLFELRPSATVEGSKRKQGLGSGASVQLHAKTFAVDRERIFVGSFNFDQRSAHLNTEMGLLIHSPALARRLSRVLDEDFASIAYEAMVGNDGRCPIWVERTEEGPIIHDVEPETGAGRRALIELLQALPIEWLL
jgi:putative cardiolipin synthase